MTYPEALRWLANKYNIEIQERELTDQEKQNQSERESMFIVNEWAADYFEELLHNDPDGLAIGMQYFRGRGFRDDVIRKFRLGFDVKDRKALARVALQKGYKEEFLLKTGICYKTDSGDLIDRYAERVIFPWISVSGKVVGFSARVLDSRTKGVNQKYVNSPESEIYQKRRELFGIFQAKRAVAKEDRVFIVEGQTDVISMHQCGIENVVANSGTALDLHQIHMLHRFTSNITLLYDGDAAGEHAAMRGTDMLLSEGMNIKVLFLPDGDDPDSFARKHTAEDFRRYVEEHQTDFVQFKIDRLLKDAKDPQQRTEAIDSIVMSISLIPNQILRDTYLHDAAQRIGMSEQTLINRMNTLIRERKDGNQPGQPSQQPATPQSHITTPQVAAQQKTSEVERMIAQMVVRHGEHVIMPGVIDDDGNAFDINVAQFFYYNLMEDGLEIKTPIYNRILMEALEQSMQPDFKAEPYFCNHSDIEMSRVANELAIDTYALLNNNKVQQPRSESEAEMMREKETTRLKTMAMHLAVDFRIDFLDSRLKQVQAEITASSGNPQRMMELLAEYKQLQQQRVDIAKQIGLNVR